MITAMILVPLILLGLLVIIAGLQGTKCDRQRCSPYEAQYHRSRPQTDQPPAAPPPAQALYLKAE